MDLASSLQNGKMHEMEDGGRWGRVAKQHKSPISAGDLYLFENQNQVDYISLIQMEVEQNQNIWVSKF